MNVIIDEFSELTEEQVEWLLSRGRYPDNTLLKKDKPKKQSSKLKRCKDTIDWVEVEYGDAYEKAKKGEVGY